jgi:hypothetical protein
LVISLHTLISSFMEPASLGLEPANVLESKRYSG